MPVCEVAAADGTRAPGDPQDLPGVSATLWDSTLRR